jgi:hypothetical protein
MTIPPIPPPADRFRVGDVWRSPRLIDWEVIRQNASKGSVTLYRRDPVLGVQSKSRDWYATGRDMTNAWERISWGGQP